MVMGENKRHFFCALRYDKNIVCVKDLPEREGKFFFLAPPAKFR
jgi:hypothetical protein